MARNYPIQKTGLLLDGVTLESTYADARSFTLEVGGMSEIVVYVDYAMGATETSNSIEVKIETGPDTSNLYRTTNESVSAGTTTVTAAEYTHVGADADTSSFQIPLSVQDEIVKVSFKETGVAANKGTVTARVTQSGK